jgi:hypothetical protein
MTACDSHPLGGLVVLYGTQGAREAKRCQHNTAQLLHT